MIAVSTWSPPPFWPAKRSSAQLSSAISPVSLFRLGLRSWARTTRSQGRRAQTKLDHVSVQGVLDSPKGDCLVETPLAELQTDPQLAQNTDTEIDFSTYLQQAQAFLDGERDYAMLKGESGPAK